MKVAKNVVVSIAYQVRTEDGVLVDEAPANQPLQYLQGHNNLVIGLENALEGKSVGDKFEVRVKPEEGYGEYNENMVQRVPKDVFVGVDDLAVGMRFIADTDMGPLPVVITEVGDNDVVVDGNHMLAGQELHFTVEVAVRPLEEGLDVVHETGRRVVVVELLVLRAGRRSCQHGRRLRQCQHSCRYTHDGKNMSVFQHHRFPHIAWKAGQGYHPGRGGCSDKVLRMYPR